jgi:hypothetical protein
MLRIAWLHRGSLLWHEAEGQAICTLRLPLRQKEPSCADASTPDTAANTNNASAAAKRPQLRLLEGGAAATNGHGHGSAPLPPAVREQPDFVQLLCDKLSPVYTALAPCIGTMDG